jgi:alkanesulfonate monooxygenase SsuD/methylene tetrahydromethanopterin reductase-like flavin-dependent oxidoreductase (luciferase family)
VSDYGPELRFGSFLTPTSADPHQVVALAERSEELGLDLVTFQDHPYQPALLDAWTLLSYVAARTERIRLAPNVLNLPLRPPAVVARAAAGLDLLSGGRFDLALGAGAFWDAMVAMGAPRRTPGESISALTEAISVIRTLWDTDTRGGVRLDGDFYPVTGAKRGPAPAHPMEIWLGGYKPRMLRLIGREADGWLPSMGHLSPEQLAPALATIDEAARGAGREPRSIRRLYNINGTFSDRSEGFLRGPARQWIEQLSGLVLTQGMSTFILGSDDGDDLARFAAEVAPGVREAVAAERSTSGRSGR